MGCSVSDRLTDLKHRLPDHGVPDGASAFNTNPLDDIVAYAQSKGFSKDQLMSALKSQSDSTIQIDNERSAPLPVSAKDLQTTPHLSVTSVLFFIGGILLFIGIIYGIFKQEDALDTASNALLLGGLGVLFWILAKTLLGANKDDNDTAATGLGDSAILVGSLFFFVCAFHSLQLISEGFDNTRSFIAMVTLWITTLALMHYAFDTLVKRVITISIAALAAAAAFYSSLWILFLDTASITIYILMVTLLGVYFFAIGRAFTIGKIERKSIGKSFYSLGGLIVLGSLYSLTVSGSHEMAWTLLYPAFLYGAFMLSVRSKSKVFLTTGSLFLIVFVTTIIVKYFAEGLGPAVAFIVAAIAITGSALFSLYLKNKYFQDEK